MVVSGLSQGLYVPFCLLFGRIESLQHMPFGDV
jgi:hypothetical protein